MQRGAAATELQTRSEFTQVYEAAKRRVAQGHLQKKIPRVERTTSHKKKTICAEISPNARRCQRVFCALFLSYVHGTSSLGVPQRGKCRIARVDIASQKRRATFCRSNIQTQFSQLCATVFFCKSKSQG